MGERKGGMEPGRIWDGRWDSAKDFRFCYKMLKGFEKEGYSYERLTFTVACRETRPWEGKGKRGRGVPLQWPKL